jgi:hypothetical protein
LSNKKLGVNHASYPANGINTLPIEGKTDREGTEVLSSPQDYLPGSYPWSPDLVIYHDKCADGIVAAWACWKRWGDAPEYLAANYGHQPPANVANRNILIVDFSYPADDLRSMVAAGARSIVVLDHHKTAQEALEPFTCWGSAGRLEPVVSGTGSARGR